jgi:hypothetical protein
MNALSGACSSIANIVAGCVRACFQIGPAPRNRLQGLELNVRAAGEPRVGTPSPLHRSSQSGPMDASGVSDVSQSRQGLYRLVPSSSGELSEPSRTSPRGVAGDRKEVFSIEEEEEEEPSSGRGHGPLDDVRAAGITPASGAAESRFGAALRYDVAEYGPYAGVVEQFERPRGTVDAMVAHRGEVGSEGLEISHLSPAAMLRVHEQAQITLTPETMSFEARVPRLLKLLADGPSPGREEHWAKAAAHLFDALARDFLLEGADREVNIHWKLRANLTDAWSAVRASAGSPHKCAWSEINKHLLATRDEVADLLSNMFAKEASAALGDAKNLPAAPRESDDFALPAHQAMENARALEALRRGKPLSEEGPPHVASRAGVQHPLSVAQHPAEQEVQPAPGAHPQGDPSEEDPQNVYVE